MTSFFDNLLIETLGLEIKYDSIILIGSNSHADFTSKENKKKSDFDIIILGNLANHQTKTTYQNRLFDISFVNINTCIQTLYEALSGSPFAGKIFSSSLSYNIILDKNKNGEKFTLFTKYAYDLFLEGVTPDFQSLHLYSVNIEANKNDVSKAFTYENNFVKQRLFNHLINCISSIIYPFHTSGKYRGQVFKKYLSQEPTNETKNTTDFISEFNIKYGQILNSFQINSYRAIVYSNSMGDFIAKGIISDFSFGYDTLENETTLIFVNSKNFRELPKNERYDVAHMTNNIPGLKNEEEKMYFIILRQLSRDYFSKPLQKRLHFFYSVVQKLDESIKKSFKKSIKATIVKKACRSFVKKKSSVELNAFYKWLLDFDIYFPDQIENESPLITEKVINIINSTNTYFTNRNIIPNYKLFSIMKALRINIDDLELK
jgi:hypothetical protein